MKQLVEYIVSNLVNHPEDVVIEEQASEEEGSSNIIIKVNPEDIGRVIGRSGNVINAIRQIARIAAIQKGVRVRVDLKDDGREKPASVQETEEKTKAEAEPEPEVEPVQETEEKTKAEAETAPVLEEDKKN